MSPKKRRSPKVPAANVIVKNLSPRTSEEDLRKIFKSCDENIADVFVPSDRMTGMNEGYAVIRTTLHMRKLGRFYSVDAAYDAIDALDGYRMDGNVLELRLDKLPKCLSSDP
ncbi:RNA recognition motif domain [Trinorchestia longiramus]|nr:RNA recognition motif domain [Trinorchestia longiramus]